MIIHSLEYWDKASNWHIKPINFTNLTLLVGATGVGKTRILQALLNLKKIIEGESLNGLKWKISFLANEKEFIWEGEFSLNEKISNFYTKEIGDALFGGYDSPTPLVIHEKLTVNSREVFVRFQRPSPSIVNGEPEDFGVREDQSYLHLLRNKDIDIVINSFKKLLYSDYIISDKILFDQSFIVFGPNFFNSYPTFESIINSDEHLFAKFYWVSKKNVKLFKRIKRIYMGIFPQVIDLKFERIYTLEKTLIPALLKSIPFIQLREESLDKWITIREISSGMYRTFIHLLEIHLSTEHTVILIDEFENSLGINCIDEIINEILIASNKIQFIISSHHPYIINSIPTNKWKLITKYAGDIYNQDLEEYNFNESFQDGFTQLINNDEYRTGLKKL